MYGGRAHLLHADGPFCLEAPAGIPQSGKLVVSVAVVGVVLLLSERDVDEASVEVHGPDEGMALDQLELSRRVFEEGAQRLEAKGRVGEGASPQALSRSSAGYLPVIASRP